MTLFILCYALNFVWLTLLIKPATNELVILVKNPGDGEESIKTIIKANATGNRITSEYYESDGSLITLLVDFRNEVQIFRSVVLGEEERDEKVYRVVCFITGLKPTDFISPDAMAKLRQKNPGTIRQAEADFGREEYDLDMSIDVEKSSILSPHIKRMCSEARESTYIHSSILYYIANLRNLSGLASIGYSLPLSNSIRCSDTRDVNSSCLCEYEICVHWFPCGIKYCKEKNVSSGKISSRRCGIKTCRKCRLFHFYVTKKSYCLWDTVPVIL